MPTKKKLSNDVADRQALLNFLSAHPEEKFRAAQLKSSTGVPKSEVRRLLTGLSEVTITTAKTMRIPERAKKTGEPMRESKIYWYQWRK